MAKIQQYSSFPFMSI